MVADANRSRTFSVGNVALVAGDLNLPPGGQVPMMIQRPSAEGSHSDDLSTATSRIYAGYWKRVFDRFVEIDCGQHNHFDSKTNSTNTLSRICLSLPASSFPSMMVTGGVTLTPMDFYSDRLSDHAPTTLCFSHKPRGGELPLRIPSHWSKHPAFSQHLEKIRSGVDFDAMPVHDALYLAKECMREASLKVRDYLFEQEPLSSHSVLCRVCSIARAVWTGDCKLARLLLEISPIAAEHINMSSGSPSLYSVPHFEEVFRSAKAKHLEAQRSNFISQNQNLSDKELSTKKIKPEFDVLTICLPFGALLLPGLCLAVLFVMLRFPPIFPNLLIRSMAHWPMHGHKSSSLNHMVVNLPVSFLMCIVNILHGTGIWCSLLLLSLLSIGSRGCLTLPQAGMVSHTQHGELLVLLVLGFCFAFGKICPELTPPLPSLIVLFGISPLRSLSPLTLLAP